MISTLQISSFIVVYIDIQHIVSVWYVLMYFSLTLKIMLLTTKNESSTVLNLGG